MFLNKRLNQLQENQKEKRKERYEPEKINNNSFGKKKIVAKQYNPKKILLRTASHK